MFMLCNATNTQHIATLNAKTPTFHALNFFTRVTWPHFTFKRRSFAICAANVIAITSSVIAFGTRSAYVRLAIGANDDALIGTPI